MILKKILIIFLSCLFITQISIPTNASKTGNSSSSRSAKSTIANKNNLHSKIKDFKLSIPPSKFKNIGLDKLKSLLTSIRNRVSKNLLGCIICGGSYKNIPNVSNYERHHLISAKFAREHPDVIKEDDCPAVLIPRSLHVHTGSYGGRSTSYVKEENRIFDNNVLKNNSISSGLSAVLDHGVQDFIKVVNEYSSLKITKSDISSPYTKAKQAIYDRPNASPSGRSCNNSAQTPTCAPYRAEIARPLDSPKLDIDDHRASTPKKNSNDRSSDNISTPKSSSYHYNESTDFIASPSAYSNNTYNPTPTVPYNYTRRIYSSYPSTLAVGDKH